MSKLKFFYFLMYELESNIMSVITTIIALIVTTHICLLHVINFDDSFVDFKLFRSLL